MNTPMEQDLDPAAPIARLRAFSMPGGEAAARKVRAVKITERGEMRSGPQAGWIQFTSEETLEARRSSFCWEAAMRSGPVKTMVVTDAYEEGHGRLVVKLGGLIPIKSFRGPDFDKGELQRYLASIVHCPPILVQHPSLEWTTVGPNTLRVRDTCDSTGATIDLEIDENGVPLCVRADRPRVIGKRSVLTPWSAKCSDPREWEGLRVPARNEVSWDLPEGSFTYYRSEITALFALG